MARRHQGVSDKTVNNDLIVLRVALNHAVVVGLVPRLPLKLKLLKVPKRGSPAS